MQVLLLEDDADLGSAVEDHLRGGGYRVLWCRPIAQSRQARQFNLALIDRRLPEARRSTTELRLPGSSFVGAERSSVHHPHDDDDDPHSRRQPRELRDGVFE